MNNIFPHAISFLLLAASSLAQLQFYTSVSYYLLYDDANQPISTLACADWAAASNYTILSDVPAFPFVRGASIVRGNKAACGDCFSILDEQTGITVNVTVVDLAASGFTISLEAFNVVTDGTGGDLGLISSTLITEALSPDACNP